MANLCLTYYEQQTTSGQSVSAKQMISHGEVNIGFKWV